MAACSALGVHWKQFIAECGIERSALPLATNGTQERLPNRNPIFPQSPRLPLYKEILRIFAKLRKNERKSKRNIIYYYYILWFFQYRVTGWQNADVQGVCTLFEGWQGWQKGDRNRVFCAIVKQAWADPSASLSSLATSTVFPLKIMPVCTWILERIEV